MSEGRWLARVMAVGGARVLLMPLSAVALVLVPRTLGASDYGEYGLALSIILGGIQFGNLGFHAASSYLVAKDPSCLRSVLGNAVILSLAGCVLALIVVLIVWCSVGTIGPWSLFCIALGIPLGLASMFVQSLLIGLHATAWYSIANGVQVGGGALFAVLLVTGNCTSPALYLAAGLIANALTVLVVGPLLWRQAAGGITWSGAVLRQSFGYGARSYACCILLYILNRGVIWWVEHAFGRTVTGHFTLALNLVELAVMMAATVAAFLTTHMLTLATDADRRRLLGRVASVLCPAYILGFVVPMAWQGEWLIGLLFGPSFLDVGPIVRHLLPYGFCVVLSSLLTAYYCALGIPLRVVVAFGSGVGFLALALLVGAPSHPIAIADALSAAMAVVIAVLLLGLLSPASPSAYPQASPGVCT